MLRLVGIGALGNMLSPAAYHLKPDNNIARFVRIQDRNPANLAREERREAWRAHGARLVSSYEDLISPHDFDGILICAGKNGDDASILAQIIPLICEYFPPKIRPFILHCSTVSIEFVNAAYEACQKHNIAYLNYPLTGGAKGAQGATMLILASGDGNLFNRLEPALSQIGKPKYFSREIDAAAKVKLIGHLMVFNGLIGISSAVALQTQSVQLANLSQEAFFDFLNQGAGGTRQWDVALKQAVSAENWQTGFLLPHATIDAIYTADLLIKYNLPAITVFPILQLATAFSFLIHKGNVHAATQSLLQALLTMPTELEEFISRVQHANTKRFLENVIDSLPSELAGKARLDISVEDLK